MFVINDLNPIYQQINDFDFSISIFDNNTTANCDNNDTVYGMANLTNGQIDDISVKNGLFGFVSKSTLSITGSGVIIRTNIKKDFTRIAKANSSQAGILKYIDGCSNQELISPSVIYNPTIQYLFFPKNIEQTPHIHKSFRLGMVLHGEGVAVANDYEIKLKQHTIFMLPADENHYFKTTNSEMSLMVFHPDSDVGPTDELNNMIIRTLINHA